ncbi:MAG: T9SS type A sorting domain-containing protein [Bacteroidetes bacterium]|nr:MAG: T9SS type A sorting domain-containing protein [Bacteroidota bacterium]
MKGFRRLFCLLFLIVVSASVVRRSSAQNNIVLTPNKDNTLYESATGALSNGAGEHLFVGQTNLGFRRRILLSFALESAIPSGAEIDSVQLTLHMSRTPLGANARRVSIHRVLADWGEGSSDALFNEGSGTAATPDDATWVHTFFDTAMWQNSGGDFDKIASASLLVDQIGTYTWKTSPKLVADVRDWLEKPLENFGWLLFGDEEFPQTTKRFDSRENPNGDFTPKLHIYYSVPTHIETESVPSSLQRLQNYPNPFTHKTTISFNLDAPQRVILEVFDMLGRKVATPMDSWHEIGPHPVSFDAGDLPPGIYFYRLTGSDFQRFAQMVVSR